jgi:1,4-alpha-glucan branching enzyme
MPLLSQLNITADTPMGANLVAGGATFRVWAPSAAAVYLNGVFAGVADWSKDASPSRLVKDNAGYWAGFLPGVAEGDLYKYYVVGPPGGSAGYKRDPYARELTPSETFPDGVNCVVRSPSAYPWHDAAFSPPQFSDMIVYQLHVGTYASSPPAYGTFLDVIEKLEYLVALGVNVLQPLPVTECEESPSLGYNGADYFSPETLYTVYDPAALAAHLGTINRLLAAKGFGPIPAAAIASGADQLRALVDLCHVYGIAVAFDVVYNHAGGFAGDDESFYFWDREADPANNDNSQYFIDRGLAGGLAFALWKQEVRQFLIDNASFWLREYHVDGFRYDEVSELLANNETSGWAFCQELTGTVRFVRDRALQNAEYWPPEYPAPVASVVGPSWQGGAGFDVVQHDALRLAVRGAIAAASYGGGASVSMRAIGSALGPPGVPNAWNAVTCVENHDVVYSGRDARIPALADGSDHQSPYARSRSKVATGILLAAPGIPQLFMGQEFLEDKPWDTNPAGSNLLDWGGLAAPDKAMVDQLRFTQDFVRLRRGEPALRGESLHVFHVHDVNRVVAFHRWVEGQGRDVVVVASLNDAPFFGYALGFPRAGAWTELFNSDIYDNWVNPLGVGNEGGIVASGPPLHDLPSSASITIPPRAILVFGLS